MAMIEGKGSIKFLRRLGITLIFLPELITTLIGVVFVVLARHLSRRREASFNRRLREKIKCYLAHAKHWQSPAYPDVQGNSELLVGQDWRAMEGGTICHATDMEICSERSRTRHSGRVQLKKVHREVTPNRTGKFISHVIDRESLPGHYQLENGTMTDLSWVRKLGMGVGARRHFANMTLARQRYATGNLRDTKAEYKSINMRLLQQGHTLAMNYMMIAKAVRHNNYYYDLTSKRSVIGAC